LGQWLPAVGRWAGAEKKAALLRQKRLAGAVEKPKLGVCFEKGAQNLFGNQPGMGEWEPLQGSFG